MRVNAEVGAQGERGRRLVDVRQRSSEERRSRTPPTATDSSKDGNNASPIVASVRVPRGNYAITGHVTINNRSEKDGNVQTACWLLAASERIDIAQGAVAESGVLEPNAMMVMPLQGIAKFKSPKTIAIRCLTDSRKVAHGARLTAIKVARVSFQRD